MSLCRDFDELIYYILLLIWEMGSGNVSLEKSEYVSQFYLNSIIR